VNTQSSTTRLLAIFVGLASLTLADTQQARAQQARLTAGTLTCRGSGSVGLIVGSRQRLSCVFNPAGSTPPQQYSARITRLGLDLGIKGPSVMVWTVLATTNALTAGALAGSYVGASASASAIVGAGANALIGGSRNSVVLQPLSVQVQTGLNIAAGVAGLTLTHQGHARAR
jgi:hypothetical protein